MSSAKTPCAGCRNLRRKCTEDCVFARYFPPELPGKFEVVRTVYGASTVARILHETPVAERVAAATSLVYEADARLKDPIYGCVGSISILQHKLKQVQTQLDTAKQELATYMEPSAMNHLLNQRFMPQFQNQQASIIVSNLERILGFQLPWTSRDAQDEQQLDARRRQMVEAARERHMLSNLKHNLQQPHIQQTMDLLRFNRRVDDAESSSQTRSQLYEAQQPQLVEAAREQDLLRNLEDQNQQQQLQHQQRSMDLLTQATDSGFTRLTDPGAMSPSLALGGLYDSNVCQIQQQRQSPPHKELLQPPRQLMQHQAMPQQQNQSSQLQPYPQQEQLHHLQSNQQ